MPSQQVPVKAVLFDLDDTLWPIAPTIIRAEALQYEWLAVNAPATVARAIAGDGSASSTAGAVRSTGSGGLLL